MLIHLSKTAIDYTYTCTHILVHCTWIHVCTEENEVGIAATEVHVQLYKHCIRNSNYNTPSTLTKMTKKIKKKDNAIKFVKNKSQQKCQLNLHMYISTRTNILVT